MTSGTGGRVSPYHQAARIERAHAMADIARRLGADREVAGRWTGTEWDIVDQAYCAQRKLKAFRSSSDRTRRACVLMLPVANRVLVSIPEDPFVGSTA